MTDAIPPTIRFICPMCRTHYFRPLDSCQWCAAVPVETIMQPSRDQFGRVKVQR